MRPILAFVAVFLGGCCGVPAVSAPAAMPVAVSAVGAPCAVAAMPPVALVPTGATMRVGAPEYARAMMGMPGAWVACASVFVGETGMALSRAVTCLGQSFVPVVQPSVSYTYGVAPVAAPAAAAPCAPAAVPQPPAGQWRWVPVSTPSAAPTPPVGNPCACEGGVCAPPVAQR